MALTFGLLLACLTGEILLRVLAIFLPNVAYLAHAGLKTTRPVSGNLQEFLAYPEFQMHPLTDFYGYATNNFGFVDKDFQFPKPSGRKRVLAVGDSFVHGTVPYPSNVITQMEELLKQKCPETDFEIYNLGIAGAGVFEYDELLRHVQNQFEPDMVVLHFYVGNDGPDVFHEKDTSPRSHFWAFDSALLRFMWNSWIVIRGADVVSVGAKPGEKATYREGAQKTDLKYDFRDDRPPLKGPTIFGENWSRIARDELLHFYAARGDSKKFERSWRKIFAMLEKTKLFLEEKKVPLLVVLYPSEIQIDSRKEEFAFKALSLKQSTGNLTKDDFDLRLPNKTLLTFCQAHQIPFFDLTDSIQASCQQSGRSCYIPQNTHWNILGNEIAGRIEAEHVAPLICKN